MNADISLRLKKVDANLADFGAFPGGGRRCWKRFSREGRSALEERGPGYSIPPLQEVQSLHYVKEYGMRLCNVKRS